MLGTLEKEKKQDWKSHIEYLVYAYNAIPHESTGVAPFELMFGRKPILPVDLMFEKETQQAGHVSQTEYIQQLKDRMRTTQEIAKQYADQARVKQKTQFDKKAKATKLEIGDKVLVKVLAFDGPHKLADKFEEDIYTVTNIPNMDIPVFEVCSADGKTKLLHRNHLFPIKTDLVEKTVTVPKQKVKSVELVSAKEPRPGKDVDSGSTDTVIFIGDAADDDDSVKEYVIHTYQPGLDGDAHRTIDRIPGGEERRGTEEEEEEEEEDDENDDVDVDSDIDQSEDSNHQSAEESEAEAEVLQVVEERPQAEVEQPEEPVLRRSTRARKPPEWFKSYLVGCLVDKSEPDLFDASKYFK
jgi:hypothetical protein